jgi:hypothetical protein
MGAGCIANWFTDGIVLAVVFCFGNAGTRKHDVRVVHSQPQGVAHMNVVPILPILYVGRNRRNGYSHLHRGNREIIPNHHGYYGS